MQRERVKSSMAKSIGYDPYSLTLEIEFRTGEVWQYTGIVQEQYDEMMDGSIGQYFQEHIKGKFREQRVDAPPPTN
jgi:hypothetical protein